MNYDNINKSLDIFYKWAKRGFITGQIKEKYDSTRWYASFYIWGLHTFFFPGHYYYRWPKWTWELNEFSSKIMKYTGIEWLVLKWQIFCYRKAYHEVLTKYPDIDHCIDHDTLLDPKILKKYKEYREKI